MFWPPKPPGKSPTMPYPAASVANGFLQHSFSDGNLITPMKIQKLVYIAHGCTLVECEAPLLDELFEAWKFGPVLSSLYHSCKHYRRRGIDSYLHDADYDAWFDRDEWRSRPAPVPAHPEVCDILNFVWGRFGGRAPMALSAWTHQTDGPWHRVTDGGTKMVRHQVVSNDLIRSFFEEHLYE